MKKSRSNAPGTKGFGGIGGNRHTTPNVTSLQMALARDDKRSNNKTDQQGRGAYNFNYNKRTGGKSMAKWLA